MSASAYGRHVEALVGGDAGVRTGRDVAHRAAARFARGQARVGQAAHRGLDVVELDEMELHVLAGGDVAEAARIAFADVGQRVELIAVNTPCGILTRSICASSAWRWP